MADLPPLTSLRAFWYVAEYQSFKAASQALFVTQTAVSHQIRQLEEFLGVTLFERGNRELRLTHEGQRLMPYVQQGFTALRAGVTLVKGDTQPNVMTLSVAPAFAARWLVPHLGSLQAAHPELRVRLMPSEALEVFSDGEVDLAIRCGSGRYQGLHSELLLRDSLIAVAAPGYLPQDKLALEERMHRVLLDNPDNPAEGWIDWLRHQGVEPGDAERINPLVVTDDAMLLDAALAGQGVALARRSLCHELLARGALHQVHPHEMDCDLGYYLVAPEAHFVRPKVKQFAHWVREEVRQSFGPDMVAYHGT